MQIEKKFCYIKYQHEKIVIYPVCNMCNKKYPIPEEFTTQAAAMGMSPRRLQRIAQTVYHRQRNLMVIMEDVHNPHNLAAIARSCDAFGIQQVAFTLENHELFDPKQIGKVTSASASKWLDYRIFKAGTEEALTTLKQEGWHIMATWVNPKAHSIYEIDFTQFEQLALMVGNEHAGLSETAISLADSHMYIPMMGMIESFNVSVAAALSLFEITRQRLINDQNFLLGTAEIHRLIDDFMQRSLAPRHRNLFE